MEHSNLKEEMLLALFDTTYAPYVPFGSRTLSLNATGTDVAVIQSVYNLMLQTMNPPQGPMGSPINITGTYDASTVAAVKNIQSYFGITVDGVAGANTYFLFGQGVGGHTTYGGPVYGSRQLSVGNAGGDVIILQNRLNCFRYASILGGPATGTFNSATAAAVLAFKKDSESNGDTGFPDNAIAGYGYYDATWIYTFAGGRAIETGRNGFDVVFLQVVLKGLGYYSDRITGYYDSATRNATQAFQGASGIKVDGVVGPVTFYRLGVANPVPPPQPLNIAWPPKPVAEVTVCSVALTTTTGDLHPYGVASLVINQSEGFESLDVTGNGLNPPSYYGSYNAYQFTLTDPKTRAVIETVVMTLVTQDTNPGDWSGTFSPGVKEIPRGMVAVYPLNTMTGETGSSIVKGDLAHCH